MVALHECMGEFMIVVLSVYQQLVGSYKDGSVVHIPRGLL